MALLDSKKAIIIMRLIVLFLVLGFSHIHFSVSVTSAKDFIGFNIESLRASSMEIRSIPDVQAQGTLDARYSREGIVTEGRMDFASNDYPGTGANNHHDPRPPARD